jgi:hypothetical protein
VVITVLVLSLLVTSGWRTIVAATAAVVIVVLVPPPSPPLLWGIGLVSDGSCCRGSGDRCAVALVDWRHQLGERGSLL